MYKNNNFKNNNLKKNNFKKNIYQKKILKKKYIPKTTNYLHINKKLKKSIFLKNPNFNDIFFPFSFNYKLIYEFLKKK